MDFRLEPGDEAFRLEVREFIKKEWHPARDYNTDLGVFGYDFDSAEYRAASHEFTKKLVAKGWYSQAWPVEWGGQNAPMSKLIAYSEEMAYANAPGGGPAGNITGAIMLQGSDWLKKEFLPRMARAEINWAQGFSEPNAGTDLANLQTRGVVDGDDIVVTGQKIWSSGSHFADWYHVLVRTDPTAPKHRGISYLIMQLKDEKGNQMPGVTLRPLYDMFGKRRWNEVFMDEVRVPKRYMIGEMNRGWYAAMTTLNFERAGGGGGGRIIKILEDFITMLRGLQFNGESPLDDPLVRHRLADLRVRLEAARMLGLRITWMHTKGLVPEAEGAISNYHSATTAKFYFWPTLAQIMGPYRALLQGETRSPDNGRFGTNYALSMVTGYAGGGGILLSPNIIAQRGLGLPR